MYLLLRACGSETSSSTSVCSAFQLVSLHRGRNIWKGIFSAKNARRDRIQRSASVKRFVIMEFFEFK